MKSNFYNKTKISNSAWMDVSIHFFLGASGATTVFPYAPGLKNIAQVRHKLVPDLPSKTEEDTQEPERRPEGLVF